MLKATSGQCMCWSYEHDNQRWLGPFEDNFDAFAYRALGPLNPVLLGS